ncbi:hypothetical protein [Streptomyces sp. VRA16 Mangrove soil]|uniref:hypothetical protein n=1 Tax=Streptomyces sp. VRA16 Mangrove soil TaxID=2817434 RepID=UPI001A9E8D3B|nr:hypothetical protein [Streptomyces sp. VRA16 Mangrove soil]MBO1330819.1 hypothetical protein [Streptomyces sp. VRA16 Mangrove soil]
MTASLLPYARLPRRHHGRVVAGSTVDAFGRAHWLLAGRRPDPAGSRDPYDALAVTVEPDGSSYETTLSGVRARFPHFDALPGGGFVVAAGRSRPDERCVQVFDAAGRCRHMFRGGDGIEHLLVDESGALWIGYFDEGVYGDDELSHAGLRRFSRSGEPLWAYSPVAGTDHISDCYALNVTGTEAWSCAYTDFQLVRNRPGRPSLPYGNPVKAARALAVDGNRVAYFGGYGEDHDRLVDCRLVGLEARPVTTGRLTRPDGGRLKAVRSRTVSRGSRVYRQEKPWTEWTVFDLTAQHP